jgi:hypothetical protein
MELPWRRDRLSMWQQFRHQSVCTVFRQAGSDVSTEHNASIFREEPSSYDTKYCFFFLTGTDGLFTQTVRPTLGPTKPSIQQTVGIMECR